MREITFGDVSAKAALGDKVHLQSQVQEVVACQESGKLMINIDADEIEQGDFGFLKLLGLTISNPETEEPIALGVEIKKTNPKKTFGRRLSEWLENDDEQDNLDDEIFFQPSASRSSGNIFGGSFGGGGFSGFGGGGFGGGGATRGF